MFGTVQPLRQVDLPSHILQVVVRASCACLSMRSALLWEAINRHMFLCQFLSEVKDLFTSQGPKFGTYLKVFGKTIQELHGALPQGYELRLPIEKLWLLFYVHVDPHSRQSSKAELHNRCQGKCAGAHPVPPVL